MTYNVYADVILLNNFTMDFLLLTTVQRMMKLKARRGGIVLASLAGAFYALAAILIPLPVFFVQTFFTCAGMSTLMTLLAFRLNSPAAVLRAIGGLYLAAVLAAGIMEFFCPFGWFSAFWLYAAAALACAWLLPVLWRVAGRSAIRGRELCEVTIACGELCVKARALIDTGNHLTEPVSGKPVSILAGDAGRELLESAQGCLLVPYRSVGKDGGLLPAVRADRMEIQGSGWKQTVERPLIAVSARPLSREDSYQMLLNEKFWM